MWIAGKRRPSQEQPVSRAALEALQQEEDHAVDGADMTASTNMNEVKPKNADGSPCGFAAKHHYPY